MPDPDPATALHMALASHRAGRLEDAELGYRLVLGAEPGNADALHLLGVLRRTHGDALGAVALIEQALRLTPCFPAAQENLGNALRDLGRFDDAAAAYTTALDQSPGQQDVIRKLVGTLEAASNQHLLAGRTATARALLEQLLELVPDRLDVITALLPLSDDAEHLNVLVLAERAWRLQPDEVRWKQLWDLHYFAGRTVKAARAFVAKCPHDAVRLVALGNALRRNRAGWDAEATYRLAIAASPELPFARGRLACLLIELGRYDEADDLLRQSDALYLGRTEVMHFGARYFARLHDRPLPPPPGPLEPLPPGHELVVFAACDGVYFDRFLSALLHSCVRNLGRPCCFHVHVVNPPADANEQLEAWRHTLGRPTIVLTVENVDMTGWEAEAQRTWFACARFRLLPHLLSTYRRQILVLDADLIVLRELSAMLAGTEEGDFALVAMPFHEQEPWNWFWADVIVVNPTELAQRYFGLVAKYVDAELEAGRARWFLDQIALAACHLAGFRGQAAATLVVLPPDMHRLSIAYVDGTDEQPAATVLFWSAHASIVDTSRTLQTPRYQDYVLPKALPSAPQSGA